MIYCDFGEDITHIRTVQGVMKLKRYAAFTSTRVMPSQALFRAKSVICEENGKVYWYKNREIREEDKMLTAEELKQFMWQKLSTEVVK